MNVISIVAIACLVASVSALPINNRNNFGSRAWQKLDGVKIVGEISGDIVDASVSFDQLVFSTVEAGTQVCATTASNGSSKGCISDSAIKGGCVPAFPTETVRYAWYCKTGSSGVSLYDFTGTPTVSSAGTCTGALGMNGSCSPNSDATAFDIDVVGGSNGITVSWGDASSTLDAASGTSVESFTALDLGSKHYFGVLGTDTGLTLVDVNGQVSEMFHEPMTGVKDCQARQWFTGLDRVYAVCCAASTIECRIYTDSGNGLELTTSYTSDDEGTALALSLDDILVVKDSQFLLFKGLITDNLSSNGRSTAGTGSTEETTLIVAGDKLSPRVLAASSTGARILAACNEGDEGCYLYSNLGGGDGEYAVPVLVASVVAITIIPSSIYAYRTKKICAKPISKADSPELAYDEEKGIHYDPHYESYVNQFEKSKGRKGSI